MQAASHPVPTLFCLPFQIRGQHLVAVNERNTLSDVLLEIGQASVEEGLLLCGDGTDGVNLLNTVGSELDVGGEVIDALSLVEGRFNECGLDNTGLTVHCSDKSVGEEGTGVSHGKSGRSGTGLGLDNFVTTELDSVDESLVSLTGNTLCDLSLREEGDDGYARVTTDNGDLGILRVSALDLRKKSRGSNDVEGGNTEQTLLIENTSLLENLSEDGHGRVHRVRDDSDHGLGAVLSTGLGESSNDRGVGVEQVVSGHTGLSGDTSGDHDDLGTLEGVSDAERAKYERKHRNKRKREQGGVGGLLVHLGSIFSPYADFESRIGKPPVSQNERRLTHPCRNP